MLGAWYAPVTGSSGFRQNINVFRFAAPQGVALADIVGNSVRAMQNSSNIVFIKHGLNARCARSSQIVSEEYSSNGVNMFIEQVMTIADGRLFVATYTREQGELRSPEAERAVEAMCPLSSA
ncbi:MAG TPA: hypothetical protein VME66_15210 [Candidatus Acidoferrales bacterium]|nr:hypothetical protein [Candidatus Acidoferrales bacterium]